jgi:hypothetical protein
MHRQLGSFFKNALLNDILFAILFKIALTSYKIVGPNRLSMTYMLCIMMDQLLFLEFFVGGLALIDRGF